MTVLGLGYSWSGGEGRYCSMTYADVARMDEWYEPNRYWEAALLQRAAEEGLLHTRPQDRHEKPYALARTVWEFVYSTGRSVPLGFVVWLVWMTECGQHHPAPPHAREFDERWLRALRAQLARPDAELEAECALFHLGAPEAEDG